MTDLFAYVANESGIDRGELVLQRIQATISALADGPGIGRVRDDLDGSPRAFSVGPWIVLYEALTDADGVLVWRVIDGRRDLQSVVHRPIA